MLSGLCHKSSFSGDVMELLNFEGLRKKNQVHLYHGVRLRCHFFRFGMNAEGRQDNSDNWSLYNSGERLSLKCYVFSCAK